MDRRSSVDFRSRILEIEVDRLISESAVSVKIAELRATALMQIPGVVKQLVICHTFKQSVYSPYQWREPQSFANKPLNLY